MIEISREPDYRPPARRALVRMGRSLLQNVRAVGFGLRILFQSILDIRFALTRLRRQEIAYQMYLTGIKSLGVITVVALFTGMILALQTGLELRRFNQEVQIGTAVTVSILREMGPFMTGLIIAASVGSSIAAQMGTMTVSEEISALEVMSISPIKVLVMPRLVSLVVMMPLLTVYTNVLGISGGALVGQTQLDVSFAAYFDNALVYATNKDLYVGLFKSVVFGLIINTTACYQGFAARSGAVGVGQATRKTVIVSFLTILICGYIITRLFYV